MITFRQTIGFRLVLVSFLMLTLPLILDAVIVFTRGYETRIAAWKNYLSEAAILRALPIASYQPIPNIAFDVVVRGLGIEKQFPQQVDPSLNKALLEVASINNLNELAVVTLNEEGQYIVVASSQSALLGTNVTKFVAEPDPFKIEKEHLDLVPGYFYYQDSLLPYILLSKGIRNEEGKPMGLIVAVQEVSEWMARIMKEDTTYYPVKFALLNPLGIVLAASDPNLLFHYFFPLSDKDLHFFRTRQAKRVLELMPKKPLQVLSQSKDKGILRFIWDNEEQWAVLESMPWWENYVLSYASRKEIYLLPLKDFLIVFLEYSFVLILGSSLIYLITKRWMRPVQDLGSVMIKVQSGDFNARYQEDKYGLHINKLGSIFNDMIGKLLENKGRAENERVKRDLLSRELKLGKEAQRRLLKEPDQDFGEVDVAQSYIPASEVGGDFYDIFRKRNGKLVLMVADASGKGVLACCFSLVARNILHTLAQQFDDVGEALVRGNNLFCDDTGESGMFVTVEMAQYDYESRLLSYYSLGHNPGILCRQDGSIERLSIQDMAMGVLPKKERAYAQDKQLHVGDVVCLYTDGITEMHNPQSELFGEERLIEVIRNNREQSAAKLVNAIEEAVQAFANGRQQFDDVTVVVVKING